MIAGLICFSTDGVFSSPLFETRSFGIDHCRSEDDTIGDLKKLLAAQIGTRPEKIRIQKWYTIYKDHITLEDCTYIL